MIPVFETHVGSVDLSSRRESSMKGVATFLNSEEIWIGCGRFGQQSKRARHAMYHRFGVLNASLSRLCDVPLKPCDDCLRVLAVVVN